MSGRVRDDGARGEAWGVGECSQVNWYSLERRRVARPHELTVLLDGYHGASLQSFPPNSV